MILSQNVSALIILFQILHQILNLNMDHRYLIYYYMIKNSLSFIKIWSPTFFIFYFFCFHEFFFVFWYSLNWQLMIFNLNFSNYCASCFLDKPCQNLIFSSNIYPIYFTVKLYNFYLYCIILNGYSLFLISYNFLNVSIISYQYISLTYLHPFN